MKKIIFNALTIVMLSSLALTSCKKDNPDPSIVTDDSEDIKTTSSDNAMVQNSSDEVVLEADEILSDNTNTRGRTAGYQLACNVTVDSTTVPGELTVTYNGASCDGLRTRTGSIKLQLSPGMKWKDAGAVLSITFTDFKVTRIADNKSITFNGTKTVTNVKGGNLVTLYTGASASLVHRIKASDLKITFDDNTERNWSVARKRTLTKAGISAYGASVEGDTTVGGHAKVAEWGTNRKGQNFYTIIDGPLVWKSTCKGLVSGLITFKGINAQLAITYGVKADGSINTSLTECPYGYKLNWVSLSGAKQAVISY